MSDAPERDDDIHPVSRHFLWLDRPAVRQAPFYIFGALAIGLLIVEAIHPRHAAKWEALFGFYELEGFFGFCLAVLAGWPLRALLGRRPDYYRQDGDAE